MAALRYSNESGKLLYNPRTGRLVINCGNNTNPCFTGCPPVLIFNSLYANAGTLTIVGNTFTSSGNTVQQALSLTAVCPDGCLGSPTVVVTSDGAGSWLGTITGDTAPSFTTAPTITNCPPINGDNDTSTQWDVIAGSPYDLSFPQARVMQVMPLSSASYPDTSSSLMLSNVVGTTLAPLFPDITVSPTFPVFAGVFDQYLGFGVWGFDSGTYGGFASLLLADGTYANGIFPQADIQTNDNGSCTKFVTQIALFLEINFRREGGNAWSGAIGLSRDGNNQLQDGPAYVILGYSP